MAYRARLEMVEWEPGLADAGRTAQREQALVIAEQARSGADLGLTPDKRRE